MAKFNFETAKKVVERFIMEQNLRYSDLLLTGNAIKLAFNYKQEIRYILIKVSEDTFRRVCFTRGVGREGRNRLSLGDGIVLLPADIKTAEVIWTGIGRAERKLDFMGVVEPCRYCDETDPPGFFNYTPDECSYPHCPRCGGM